MILGFISSNKGLMGGYALGRTNKVVYWAFLALIFGTGLMTVAPLL